MRLQMYILTIFISGFISCHDKENSCLTPEESLTDFEVEEGFRISCVAHEPDVQDPVAIAFDDDANMWVVEMNTYMPDVNGIGEQVPLSSIKILSDKDKDGYYESVKVFADSLTLPRAVCPVYGGVLVAEPPFLWFYDEPGAKRVVVDSFYADGGNVEHQANGLLLGLDNWIYSAKSVMRYRRNQGKWEKESTIFRGQWGIDQDVEGRLFYNHNSAVLLGDQYPPSVMPHLSILIGDKIKNQFGQSFSPNRVYPRHPTLGVNRGYESGVLDSAGRLTDVTSACGVSICSGGQFGQKYEEYAISCEPAAQLVRRVILGKKEGKIVGKLPYTEKEFLRSGDERFRPVYSITGPDGALYIVDMYRGIIQHNTYMTGYLREYIEKHGLDKVKGMGRIYRIQYGKEITEHVRISDKSGKELVDMLQHSNKWVRIRAQWKILNENDESKYQPMLKECYEKTQSDITKLHILHIISMYQKPDNSILLQAAASDNEALRHQAISALSKTDFKAFQNVRNKSNQGDEIAYVAAAFRDLPYKIDISRHVLLGGLIKEYANDSLFAAIIAGSLWQYGNNEENIRHFKSSVSKNSILNKWLDKTPIPPKDNEADVAHLTTSQKEMYYGGLHAYEAYCSGCHGKNGEGVDIIGPPLAQSEWVTASDRKIPISIVLNGISGPITVNGKSYTFNGPMPGLKDNQTINNGTIANILTFVRNSWGNKADAISTEDVSKVRMADPMILPTEVTLHNPDTAPKSGKYK